MAANDIIYIPNQPVQFWKVNPTDEEIEQGMTSWANSAYHLRRGNCGFNGPRYCQPYSINQGDILTFQFKASTIGDNVLTPFYTPIFADDNTSVVTDQLVDSGATFQASVPDAEVDMFVLNTTTPASSVITSVLSETELELFDDIFLASPEGYEVYSIKGSVGWHWNTTTDVFYRVAAANLGITFENCLTINSWYKVTITVVDITLGEINIKLGNNIIATITSVGTHIVYGQCLASDDFIIDPEDFVGSISTDIDVRLLKTSYLINYYDLDGNIIISEPHNETSDSLTIGNIFYGQNVAGLLGLECDNYILGIIDEEVCEGNMVQNGDLEDTPSDLYWTFSDESVYVQEAISPATNKIYFDNAGAGSYAANDLGCDLVEGHQYTLQWDIGPIDVTKTGFYQIFDGANEIGPVYDASLQSGTITLNFTAPANSSNIVFINPSSFPDTFSLDNIILTDITTFNMEDADGLSECLCICGDQPCTTLIKFSADQPTFGNFFDGVSVEMYMRVQGRLKDLDPVDLELNSFKSTMENQEQPYSNLQDAENFATSHMPQWVHGALRVALSHPKLFIDGVAYKRIGQYAVNWGDDSEMAPAVCPVAKKNQSALRNNF